jgi:hypothetical protein
MLGRTNTGGGGGGGGLNFDVVGNPQPNNPKENTIWLNTDVPITSWIFSATEPNTAESGMVWFPVGTSSGVEFNALKKNSIQVYPLSAKQYIDGVWVDKTAKSYQGGKWVDWVTYLFNSGDFCEDITGGWTNSGYYYYSASSYPNSNPVYGEDIKFSLSAKGACIAGTANKIDLRGKKTLCVNCTAISTAVPTVSINDAKNVHSTASVASATLSVGINELDVSNIEKEAYIAVLTYSNSGAGSASVDRIWLE